MQTFHDALIQGIEEQTFRNAEKIVKAIKSLKISAHVLYAETSLTLTDAESLLTIHAKLQSEERKFQDIINERNAKVSEEKYRDRQEYEKRKLKDWIEYDSSLDNILSQEFPLPSSDDLKTVHDIKLV